MRAWNHLALSEGDVLDVEDAVHVVFPHGGELVGEESALAFGEGV